MGAEFLSSLGQKDPVSERVLCSCNPSGASFLVGDMADKCLLWRRLRKFQRESQRRKRCSVSCSRHKDPKVKRDVSCRCRTVDRAKDGQDNREDKADERNQEQPPKIEESYQRGSGGRRDERWNRGGRQSAREEMRVEMKEEGMKRFSSRTSES